MASLNKVMLIGNLGRDPETRYTQNGTAVTNFSIAVTEKWNDKAGGQQERTEWCAIVAWNKLAELAQKYLAKGRQVFVEGRLQTREWEDKEGNKRRSTEIVANQLIFLGGSREKRDNEPHADPYPVKPPYETSGNKTSEFYDDSIPF